MDSRRAGAIALTVLSAASRFIALLLCVLTVALCFNGIATKLNIVTFVVELTQALPKVIAGYGLIATPFGGVFRFDFASMAAAFFLFDYLFARLARSLR